ncbi:MAG: septal ring lytic transglycosylase RlpA family protein [Ignavibacteria bacterium]|nr:septal ring lytic transglycosylase RlpA family protein [Ignavibacteria bacterium]
MRCHLKSFSIVFLILLVVGLLGFTVVNNNNGTEEIILVVDEFIPLAVKENTVKTSVVELIDRGTMKASWYGSRFHGKKTANGEIYDQMAYTAAHKSLKFGTLLKLTNTRTGKSLVVRINDRGPYIPRRQLDLSKAAAIELGVIANGVAKLKVEEINLGGINNPVVTVN